MTVTVVSRGATTTVRLDRPDALNALDDPTRRALADVLDALEEDTTTRVVVLEGAGRAFSAGADLRAGANPPETTAPDTTWNERRTATGSWQRVLERLGRIPQATVARLHGHVIGGGALLAAACDLRVGATSTVVRIPELAIGIPLTWAGVPLLAREVGLPRTRDWVMTGRPVEADELLASGFLQRLVPDDDLDGAVDEVVESLVSMPAGPLAMTRALTAALGRQDPGMVAGWADADLLHWSMREPEGIDAARAYDARRRGR